MHSRPTYSSKIQYQCVSLGFGIDPEDPEVNIIFCTSILASTTSRSSYSSRRTTVQYILASSYYIHTYIHNMM